jgi:hypothetical protein
VMLAATVFDSLCCVHPYSGEVPNRDAYNNKTESRKWPISILPICLSFKKMIIILEQGKLWPGKFLRHNFLKERCWSA